MKRFFVLFFLFSILSAVVTAQHNEQRDEILPSFNSIIKLKNPDYAAPRIKNDAPATFFRPSQAVTDTTIHSYSYDSSGNLLTEIQEIKLNGIWQNNTKYIYTYDNNGYQTTFIFQIWQDEEWKNIFRQTYNYNNAGLLLEFTFESFNGEWQNLSRYTYTYDNNNNPASLLAEEWDNNTWINSWRMTLDFMHSTLLESWENNAWVNDYVTTVHYDTSGAITYSLGEDWIGNNWVNDRRFSYTYQNNYMHTTIYEVWYNNEWSKQYRRTYEYDANDNIIMEVNETWLNNAWVNEYRELTIYVNNFLDSGHYDVWFNESWMTTRKWDYEYDNNGNAVSGHSYYLLNGVWVPYNASLQMYYNYMAEVTDYFCKFVNVEYDIFTSAENDLPLKYSFSLADNYPNPFNPYTTINYSIPEPTHVSIKVYNIQGSETAVLVNEQKPAGEYKVTFSSSSLASGVYFYKLTASGKTSVKKMIVLK